MHRVVHAPCSTMDLCWDGNDKAKPYPPERHRVQGATAISLLCLPVLKHAERYWGEHWDSGSGPEP